MGNRTEYRYDTPCGLYCGACPALVATREGRTAELAAAWGMEADEIECRGCPSDRTAVFCRDCHFRRCVQEKGIEYCFQCDQHPCGELLDFRHDQAAHHSVVLRNLRAMRELGVTRWLEDQERRWTCPECGASFTWYDQRCKSCDAPLHECRAEEAEIDEQEATG